MVQGDLQPASPTVQPGHDRADRRARHFGDRLVGKLADVGVEDGGLLWRRQRLERRVEGFDAAAAHQVGGRPKQSNGLSLTDHDMPACHHIEERRCQGRVVQIRASVLDVGISVCSRT